VVLQIARFARQALVNAGYEVMLTRDRDFFLSLKNRTGLANQLKADLFLSIHVNAIKVPNAWGSETYYLSPDDTFSEMADINIQLENREFEQDEPELAQPLSSEEGVDLDLILWDLAQTEFMEDSFRIAKYIQEELNILAGTKNRGVKQAPLKVLKGARMPACLVEVAFLSNPLEEQRLKDEVFLKNVAEALATAVVRYDADVRSRNQQKTRMNGTP
jgi:N-acetylmuramoyl-L-alanine amidase